MNNLFNRPWVYKIISLIFAIGLFAYVNEGSLSTTRGSQENNQEQLANKKKSVKVPLEVQSDTDKYFITGYPEKVTVRLEGPSALVTTTVNTQNFKVSADLRDLSVGKHRVRLQQQGINKDLTYQISPKYITVNIQPKQTKTFPIQLEFNKDSVADGYTIGTTKMSQETVNATGSKSDIAKVDQIIASVNTENNRKTAVDQEVLLQAVDKSGKIVNVVLDPQTIHVNIPIYLPTKKLDLDFEQSGDSDSQLAYSFTSDTTSVKVSGKQDVLDKLKSLTIPVDVTGITQTTTKDINVSLKDTNLQGVDPESVRVTIKVTQSDSSSTSKSASQDNDSSQTASSSSQSSNTASKSSSSGSQSTDSDDSEAE
ncbi:YbbR-like domain-containing protein [Agrilactobacillus yilanensis]|uniref:YbbR-like domain-containing protein n=1 Tax=Agrilactobacillus yilanensis TaxID=2485997 RepID=A0ABW4J897_9LACO|nr:CdaR family protein [Agrilactobacillus yilanensis]